MPSESVLRDRLVGRYFYGNGLSGETGRNAWGYNRFSGRSDSVRRQKPADLFKNATNFSWSLNEQTTTLARFHGGGTLYLEPLSSYIAAGQRGSSPLQPWAVLDGKLRAQIKNQNVNLAQTLAEYRQTCSMFAGAARDVLSAFRSLRSGRAFADFVRILQSPRNRNERRIANRWLEYQYGLRPLLSDILGSADLLASRLTTGYFVKVKATHKEETRYNTTLAVLGPVGYFEAFHSESHSARIKATARYKISSASLKSLTQMGLVNPLELAWELIPYSFVVDWLFPVGSWLSALDALNGTSELTVNRGSFVTFHSEVSGAGGLATQTVETKTRQASSAHLGMPSLAYTPSQSLEAVLNGLALLIQLKTGFPPRR